MNFPILLPNIFNHPFTYESDLKLEIGDFVEVPFGKSKIVGVVWNEFEQNNGKTFKIKKIIRKLETPKLKKKTLEFSPKNRLRIWGVPPDIIKVGNLGTWFPGTFGAPRHFFRKERKISSLEQASITARHWEIFQTSKMCLLNISKVPGRVR